MSALPDAESLVDQDFGPLSGVRNGYLALRADGRHEVAEHVVAAQLFGCLAQSWCVLADAHRGPCTDVRAGGRADDASP